jgi:hypothetical protein
VTSYLEITVRFVGSTEAIRTLSCEVSAPRIVILPGQVWMARLGNLATGCEGHAPVPSANMIYVTVAVAQQPHRGECAGPRVPLLPPLSVDPPTSVPTQRSRSFEVQFTRWRATVPVRVQRHRPALPPPTSPARCRCLPPRNGRPLHHLEQSHRDNHGRLTHGTGSTQAPSHCPIPPGNPKLTVPSENCEGDPGRGGEP